MSKKLQKVFSVTTSLTTILMMSGIATLAPLATNAAVAGINEGDTIRVANTFDVYIAKYVGTKMFKRLILNPEVFNSYQHLSWSKVKTVTQAQMDQFTNSSLVRALGDTKVYMLTPNGDVGTKQWLNMSAEGFTAAGYDWDSIYVINNVDRDNYTTGTDITGAGATTTPGPAGALTVALASDTPAAGVAPLKAARIPFTKVNFTAGASDVTITALTAQRTGLSADAVLSSIVLIDPVTNLQVGLNQTLDANHQVTFRETLTIPANTTKSYILGANMRTTAAATHAGEIASLSLTGITTAATVSGVLPITGNGQTINETLTIGTVTPATGSLNAATTTKEVGTTNYNFSSVKFTAGSTEDITVYSIRFNQSGSAATSDLANVVVSDGTTNYATTVSSDGKYYTASFGTAGILVAKGMSHEFTVKADIFSGSVRTIKFDIYRGTDVVVKGNTYGYYLTLEALNSGWWHTATNPVFTAAAITIGTGSLRVDKNTALAPAANVTKGDTGAILGAFDFVVQGEAVNVTSLVLDLEMTGTGSSSDLTNITLTKSDGTVLAGPVDGADDSTALKDGSATFSGTISFPVGTTPVLVKGKLSTDFAADDTIVVSFGPPSTTITGITGATTGNTITASPTSNILANTMTVKSGSLLVSVAGTPVSQSVVKGTQGFTFTNFVIDAANSGEDVKVTQVIVTDTSEADYQSDITGMQLWDGATALNTGTNVVNPPNYASASQTLTFNLDTGLIISKGTQKTIALKGNINGAATAKNHIFGIAASAITATGVSTTQTVSATITAATGQTMAVVSAGQYSVRLDSSSPTGKLIPANSTGNVMTVLRFKATSEQINVTRMQLGLTSASSTGKDIANVYIYDGSTLLGSGSFPNLGGGTGGATASTTFVLTTPLVIGADAEKIVTVKADIAEIKTTNTIATAGHIIDINYINSVSTTYNAGTGQSSGTSIAGFTTDRLNTAITDSYIYKSVPSVSKLALSSNTLTNGTIPIYKFRVAADAKGDIDLYQLTFQVATTSATSTDFKLYNVSASPEVQINADYVGAKNSTDMTMVLENAATTNTLLTIPAGTYKDFELRSTFTSVTTGSSISAQLEGDPTTLFINVASGQFMDAAADVATAGGHFIWSDWSASSHAATSDDFTTGYLVYGLPSSNLAAETLSK